LNPTRAASVKPPFRNNKVFIGGTGTDADAAPVTLLRRDEVTGADGGSTVAYEVDFRDKTFHVTPRRILEHVYKYMHDIAASHCTNVDASNTVITVPLEFSAAQRTAVAECAAAAGFRVVQARLFRIYDILTVLLLWILLCTVFQILYSFNTEPDPAF
jgi:hypothetical protein